MSTLHCTALHTRVSEWVVFSEEERVGEHGGPGRRRRTTLGLRTHASSDQLALPPGLDHILSRVCIIHASCFFCLSTATTNHYSLISRHQCPHTYCTLSTPFLSSPLLWIIIGTLWIIGPSSIMMMIQIPSMHPSVSCSCMHWLIFGFSRRHSIDCLHSSSACLPPNTENYRQPDRYIYHWHFINI